MGFRSADRFVLTVPDVISCDLRVLFVGVNPGIRSSQTRHHFAHPSGRFWKALQAGGFMPEVLQPAEEEKLLEYGLGLTNLVDRPTQSADLLTSDELRAARDGCGARLASTGRDGWPSSASSPTALPSTNSRLSSDPESGDCARPESGCSPVRPAGTPTTLCRSSSH